jgi:hypothetical protein
MIDFLIASSPWWAMLPHALKHRHAARRKRLALRACHDGHSDWILP